MIRIEVKSDAVETRSGIAQKTQKPYSIRTQEAYAHTVDPSGAIRPYPERIALQLDDDQKPFPPAMYMLQPSSVYVGDFGRLNLGRPVLQPLK
jgi:helix-destabilizing protein